MSADKDLKDAFGALGSRVQTAEPSFDQLTSREALKTARRRQRRHRVVPLAIAAAVLSVFLLISARTDDTLDYERFTALTGLDLGEVTWEAPSDFLLDFPGRELLQRVPLIDVNAPALVPDSVRSSDSNDIKRRSRS